MRCLASTTARPLAPRWSHRGRGAQSGDTDGIDGARHRNRNRGRAGTRPYGIGPAASPGSPWSIFDRVQIDLGYTYDDNVTRGRAADEILADQLLGLNVSAGSTLRINDNTRVVVTGMLERRDVQDLQRLVEPVGRPAGRAPVPQIRALSTR